jgi:hypothetical protein
MIQDKNILTHNNSINQNFDTLQFQYDVEITIDGTGEAVDVISFKTNVNYSKPNNKSYFLAEVIITNFLLNFEYPDSLMQDIALKCRKAIEKCVFKINSKNEIIELENHQEIIDNWQIIKQEMNQEYEGETAMKYMTLFEKSLQNKEFLTNKIKKNLFINQYFFPIFDTPFHNFKTKHIETFSYFDLDYQSEVLLTVEKEGKLNADGLATISKKIKKNESELFPIESYSTNYVSDGNCTIQKIEGHFQNHNKKYAFKIECLPR